MDNVINRVFEQDRYQRLFEKGVQLWRTSAIAEAKATFRTILRDKPNHSETLRFMALTVRKEGQLQLAKEMFERALRAMPGNYVAMADLANLYYELNDMPEARRHAEHALDHDPEFSGAHATLGLVAMRDSDLEGAIARFERALKSNPACLVSQANLATSRQRLSPQEALTEVEELTKLVEREPENSRAHLMLALKLDEQGHLSRALVSAHRSCQIEANASNLSQLASFLCTLGAFEDGMPIFHQGVAMAPYQTNAVAAYLFAMNYNPYTTAEELYETYVSFAQKFLNPKKRYRHSAEPRGQGRKLRIGYSSPDFKEHSLYNFIQPILEAHDRSRFELFAFSNADTFDAVSAELQTHFDHWIDVSKLSDEQMAERINASGIDVLVDLAGHSRGNRLGVFAMRPAPVQVSYLGYGYTSGLSEIDYFIGDENLTPPEGDRYFAEKVWRVPAPAYVYRPPAAAQIDVSPLPALTKGYVTFGSMSRLIRINDEVLKVWKIILDRVPGSKLRLDSLLLGDAETRDLVCTRLLNHGFQPGQLELGMSRPHWKGYAEFDISLDCWPHNTGTTTLDALWMGVPVLSKLDRPSVGRFGATFLRPMGLEDWLADDVTEYIEKAVEFASDLPRLVELRTSLRGRMQQSGLLEPGLMTAKLEAMYLESVRLFEQKKAA